MFLLAISPVILLVLFLFVLKWQLVKAAPVIFFYTAFLALWKWSLPFDHLFAALMKGALLSADVMLIVFGAVLFLNFLRSLGIIRSMEENLRALSPDKRIQAILLAWLFGSFIEGVSGFGTPAVVVAPLLVGLGFTPMTAILVTLLANSTAVPFGAVGTPIRIGLAGLDTAGVPLRTALINLFSGLLIPLMILIVVGKNESNGRWKAFVQCLPWAIFAALVFLIPYCLFSMLGQEFPSIFGGAIGLTLAIISLRYGFLVPKDHAASSVKLGKLTRAFTPYLLLLVFFILGKLVFSTLQVRLKLGGGLTHSLQLFNPGLGFLSVVILLAFYYRKSVSELVTLGKTTMGPLGKAALSIFFISSMTYVMTVTGHQGPTRPGMVESLASFIMTPALPYYSAFIGGFGSFLAGSATVSNLLFGELQTQAAQSLGLNIPWILALQLVGSGAGNMIALSNILAVQAAVGSGEKEAKVLLLLIVPCLLYLIVSTLVGILLSKIMLF